MTQPHESRTWNPIIANVFYRAAIIERWDSGTLNIIDWLKANNNPSPSWEDQAGSIYVTFRPAALPEDREEPKQTDWIVGEPRKTIRQSVTESGHMLAPSQHQVQIISSLSSAWAFL